MQHTRRLNARFGESERRRASSDLGPTWQTSTGISRGLWVVHAFRARRECQCGAEAHMRFTVACVKHAVNISLPSAGAVQMLSEKKRITAKLGGGGGWGWTRRCLRPEASIWGRLTSSEQPCGGVGGGRLKTRRWGRCNGGQAPLLTDEGSQRRGRKYEGATTTTTAATAAAVATHASHLADRVGSSDHMVGWRRDVMSLSQLGSTSWSLSSMHTHTRVPYTHKCMNGDAVVPYVCCLLSGWHINGGILSGRACVHNRFTWREAWFRCISVCQGGTRRQSRQTWLTSSLPHINTGSWHFRSFNSIPVTWSHISIPNDFFLNLLQFAVNKCQNST